MRRTFLVLILTAAVTAVAADDVPRGVPRPLDPPGNPSTPQKIALGKRLFADTRLSTDGTVSCATCHVSRLAFTDGRRVAVGVHGREGPRNTPTALNAALLEHLFHDGRAPTLEEQARQPFLNVLEMGWQREEDLLERVRGIGDYGPLFEAAFGDPAVSLQRMARAIAAFERTLLSGDAPFDRWWDGDGTAMDEAQVRGYRVFVDRGGCAQCHSIRQSHALFTDGDFHNTGAGKGPGKDDPGRAAVTGDPADHGRFRTPTLRNVALTAPYMHDGSLATLEEVVDFYVDGGVDNPHLSPLMRPLTLEEGERADLVAFLRALTSPTLPALDECERLLAEGRPEEAFHAFRDALDRNGDDASAASGMARSALAWGDRDALTAATAALGRRIRALSPDHGADAAPEVADLLFLQARTCAALAPLEEAMGLAVQEDAVQALGRLRAARAGHEQGVLLEGRLLEVMGREDDAVDALTDFAQRSPTAAVRAALAATRYRRAWSAMGSEGSPERADADLRAAAEIYDSLRSEQGALIDDGALFRAYARHRLGETDLAIDAYADAASREAVAESALTGLRNLLAADPERYRSELDALGARLPDSPAVLLFRGFELLQEGRLDEAETALRRRLEVESLPTPGPHHHLAQVHRRRGERASALDHYAVAVTLGPSLPQILAEYEGYVRERRLTGFADVDALVAEYRQYMDAGPDEPRFQVVARNNLAFILRDVAASYASRGPARVHTFPDGAPADALRMAKLCLELYEEACNLVPADVEDLDFAQRWVYAGVFNDTGLVLHYFEPLQDLERAEAYYLRSFELTGGAYQDAYFYNLQFLYGFELDGRDERWWELSRVAKDRILREDPESPTGFSPDEFKRSAARRDFERLSRALGR